MIGQSVGQVLGDPEVPDPEAELEPAFAELFDQPLDAVGKVVLVPLEPLAGLANLEWLNVDNTQLSDAGLQHFRMMNKLTFLHLGSTAVSDAGLPQLEGLASLKDLKVTRTAVTAAGVTKLQAKLPNTEIQLKYIEGE